MNIDFTLNDLKEVGKQWEEKEKEVKFWREFSLKGRKSSSVLEKIEKWQEELSSLCDDHNSYEKLLLELNQGEYEFSPFSLLYYTDKYFCKVRVTLQIDNNFKDLLVCKLIANKLKSILERDIKSFSISKNKAFNKIINKIKKEKPDNLVILKGDFVSYTQKIPRNSIIEILKDKQVPKNILKIIKNYFSIDNNISKNLKHKTIKSFFDQMNLTKKYLYDGDFKSIINADGLLAGTPLSNILGNLFLLDFDEYVNKLIDDKGIYSRYYDDFILLCSQEESKKFQENILKFLAHLYKIDIKDVKNRNNIVRLDPFNKLDFLGYVIEFKNSHFLITIRYKTLKKFIYKYLSEYRFNKKKLKKGNSKKILKKHIISKAVYLNMWLHSFIYINDSKLLDLLYIKFILPDLYYMLDFDAEKVNKIKTYFKPTLIHRQLVKKKFSFKERIENIKKDLDENLEEVLPC